MFDIERTLELWNFISTIKPDCDYYHIVTVGMCKISHSTLVGLVYINIKRGYQLVPSYLYCFFLLFRLVF